MTLLPFSPSQGCPKCAEPRILFPKYHHRIFSNIEYLEYICKSCGFCFRTETADAKNANDCYNPLLNVDLSGLGEAITSGIQLDHGNPIDVVSELSKHA